jgi:hypothetical protein
MTMAAGRARSRLDLGDVIADTFAVIQKNFAPFALAGLLLIGAPVLVQGLARIALHQTTAFGLLSLGLGLVSGLIQLIFSAGLLYATVQDLNGGRASIGEFLAVGARLLLPFLGLSILVFVAAYIGLLFLVVPGVLLFLRWSVAGAVLVAEGRGIMESMGRSAALTKGRRGAIFLLYLIIGVIVVVAEAIVLGVMGGVAGVIAFSQGAPSTPAGMIVALVVSPLLSIASTMFLVVIAGSLFHQLRASRDGVASETLARVFE